MREKSKGQNTGNILVIMKTCYVPDMRGALSGSLRKSSLKVGEEVPLKGKKQLNELEASYILISKYYKAMIIKTA